MKRKPRNEIIEEQEDEASWFLPQTNAGTFDYSLALFMVKTHVWEATNTTTKGEGRHYRLLLL